MIKHALVIILLIVFTIVRAQEQTFNFNSLTIKNGLSSGNVTCVLQDSKGFIWIGTDNGLNKFDGYQIQIFRHNASTTNTIGGNSVRCLFEDSKHNLWIGLKGDGLSRLNLKSERFTTFQKTKKLNSLSYNDASGIVEDKKGHLWIAVDRGSLDMFDPVTEIFTHHYIPVRKSNQSSNNAFTDISLDTKGNLWLSSWGEGVYCFNMQNKTFLNHPFWKKGEPDEKRCKHIFDVFIDKDNTIWVSSAHGGLYSLNESQNKYQQYTISQPANNSINSRAIRSVSDDDKGNLWIGTAEEGINILNKKTGQISSVSSNGIGEKKLLTNSVNCIYRDNNGIMWIGSSVGVNYYNQLSSQFTLIERTSDKIISLTEKHVLSLLKDKTGNIWIGGINSLDKISPNRKSIKRYKLKNLNFFDSFRYNKAICEDKTGNIWIGAYSNYLMKYDHSKDIFTRVIIPSITKTMVPYSNVYAIYEDIDNTLWIATELGTLNFNPRTGVFITLFHSGNIIYPEEKSHVVYRDRDREFWVGTEGGLRRYTSDMKLITIYKDNTNSNGLTNNFITAIHEDKNGALWIGTMGGLHFFNKKEGKFKLIKQTDNLYGDPIFGICNDQAGNLWMSTTSGVLKYNEISHKFRLYDESDGLQNSDFQLGAYFQATDGEILFGGKNGLNIFYPNNIKVNNRKPPVIITDFQIFNQSIAPTENGVLTKPIDETKEIILKHSQSVITFKFVALSFISPQKNKYAYMLSGFDQHWIYAYPNQRSATYTNLDPGNYTFKVKASNNDGLWNEKGTEITIKILPPFLETWYAYTLYVLLLISISYVTIKYFTIRERDKNDLKIAKLEAQRIQEIDEIKFNLFTNVSHEFRTPLSLILGPLTQIIEKGNLKKEDENLYSLMHRNTQRLLRLINQLLDFRKIEAGKLELNLKYDDIIKFITGSANEFGFIASENNIQFTIKSSLQELWMNFDSDKVDKVLYNLISNAFHYTPEGGKIDVAISKYQKDEIQFVQIQVSDTGIGISDEEKEMLFTIFYQGKRQKNIRNGGSGIGLVLTKNLVELHQGKILVSSEVNKGSIFTVQLPIIVSNITEYQAVEMTTSSSDSFINTTELEKNTIRNTDQQAADLLLIVEDNYDMRLYVQNILSQQFNIMVAKDGQEGLEIAQEYIPDLIISDVMMPRMDGIEMVKLLRDNEKTNHIPIILLTSRQAESQIVEGLEIGVEDYISKPFSPIILKARIQNILTSRKKMWEQYKLSKNIEEYTEKLSDSPQKQNFIKIISEIINKHIDEPEFSIEILADELQMSVNQLFRKVKALMDTTPYNVIVQIRMTQATLLMRESDKNISEISLSVGYQELSNFSRAFKKYFKVSPREYMKDYR